MEGPKRTFDDFPSHLKLRRHPVFLGLQRAYRFGKYRLLGRGVMPADA
jgi:hypothetical protein